MSIKWFSFRISILLLAILLIVLFAYQKCNGEGYENYLPKCTVSSFKGLRFAQAFLFPLKMPLKGIYV